MDVFVLRVDYSKIKDFDFAFFSDLHLDSQTHNRKEFISDIEEARARNAKVFIGGDTAELIFPTDLKRYARGRDSGDYDDKLGETTRYVYETLKPYYDMIEWIGMGNHEESTLKYNNYDLIRSVITLLNVDREKAGLSMIHHGGYKSFIRIQFHINDERVRKMDILHYHGKGGGAPVTKGMIDINRLRSDYDADIYWLGHKHTEITDKIRRIRLNGANVPIVREQRAFFTAGYQESSLHEDYNDHGYIRNFEDRQLSTTSMGNALLNVRLNTGEVKFKLTN